jgi:hypothetical protein
LRVLVRGDISRFVIIGQCVGAVSAHDRPLVADAGPILAAVVRRTLYDKSDCHANVLFDAWPRLRLRPLMARSEVRTCSELVCSLG